MIFWTQWSIELDDLLIQNEWLNIGATFILEDIVFSWLPTTDSVCPVLSTATNVYFFWSHHWCKQAIHCDFHKLKRAYFEHARLISSFLYCFQPATNRQISTCGETRPSEHYVSLFGSKVMKISYNVYSLLHIQTH